MKKILAIAIAVLMLCGTMAIVSSADSYNYNGPMDLEFSVKKADPANVIKDGVIGAGEYERLVVDNDPESDGCEFWVGYSDGDCFDYAEAMLKSVEYYFSWDDTHGFNVAVRFKPHEIKQVLDVAPGDIPKDYFLQNTGIGLELNSKNRDNSNWDGELYYTIAKRTDTGAYLNGWYTQLGLKGSYTPVAEQDYTINYGADGYVTCEWSVPFDNYIPGTAGPDTDIYFNLTVTSGTIDEYDYATGSSDPTGLYCVSLGNRGYYCKQTNDSTYVIGTLSAEMIPGGQQPNPSQDEPTQDEPTQDDPTTPDAPKGSDDETDPGTTDPQNPADPTAPKSNTDGGNKKNTKTGDAMAVLAVVSALSACGVVIGKKRK